MNEWQGWAWLVAGLLIEWTLRASLLCGVAWGAACLLRARSAAVRHAVWVGAFAGISLLPGLRFAAPSWEILPRLGGMWLTRFALEPTDRGGGRQVIRRARES